MKIININTLLLSLCLISLSCVAHTSDADDSSEINTDNNVYNNFTAVATVNCLTVNIYNDTHVACASDDATINAVVNGWKSVLGINFSDPNGTNGPNPGLQFSSVPITDPTFPQPPPTTIYNGDGCATDIQIFYSYYECDSDLDGTADSYIEAGDFPLVLFADPQAPTIVADDATCNYSVVFACPGDTEGSTSVNGSTETPGYNGNTTENIEIVTVNNCKAVFPVNKPACEAEACPIVTPVNESGIACASETGTITTLINDWFATLETDSDGANRPIAKILYSSTAVGSEEFPQAVPTGIYSGDNCANDVQTWYAYYECNNDLSSAVDSYTDAGSFTLTIFPNPQAPTIVANDAVCNYSVIFACPGDSEGATSVNGSIEETGYSGNPTETIEVTTANGCTTSFMVPKPLCSCNCQANGGSF